jgi:hypothetical protein
MLLIPTITLVFYRFLGKDDTPKIGGAKEASKIYVETGKLLNP